MRAKRLSSSYRNFRDQCGIALLEAAGIAAVMLPVVFAVYGLAEYLNTVSTLRASVEQALSLNDRAGGTLSLQNNELTTEDDSVRLRALATQTQQALLQMLHDRGFADADLSLQTFIGKRNDGSRSTVAVVDAGSLSSGSFDVERAELIALLPSSTALDVPSYGIGVLLRVRFGDRGMGIFLNSLTGTDQVSISKIQRLRREVVWDE